MKSGKVVDDNGPCGFASRSSCNLLDLSSAPFRSLMTIMMKERLCSIHVSQKEYLIFFLFYSDSLLRFNSDISSLLMSLFFL